MLTHVHFSKQSPLRRGKIYVLVNSRRLSQRSLNLLEVGVGDSSLPLGRKFELTQIFTPIFYESELLGWTFPYSLENWGLQSLHNPKVESTFYHIPPFPNPTVYLAPYLPCTIFDLDKRRRSTFDPVPFFYLSITFHLLPHYSPCSTFYFSLPHFLACPHSFPQFYSAKI